MLLMRILKFTPDGRNNRFFKLTRHKTHDLRGVIYYFKLLPKYARALWLCITVKKALVLSISATYIVSYVDEISSSDFPSIDNSSSIGFPLCFIISLKISSSFSRHFTICQQGCFPSKVYNKQKFF